MADGNKYPVIKGSDIVIESMIKNGTDVTFGYPGGSVIPLFDSFYDYEEKIKNVLVRHEQAASHAAEAYGRVTGRPGVCISTSGPGATNLITGIMNAHMDSSPMIAIGGQVPVSLLGNDAFQESDMFGITMPIVKHSFQPRKTEDIADVFMKAYKIASEGRPGPVYIDLPKDVQSSMAENRFPEKVIIESYKPTIRPNPIQIKKVVEMVMGAERPLFLAGGGVISSNASTELAELVRIVKAPVATTLMGKGSFDEYDPYSIGMVGMHGRKVANYAMLKCDLMIVVGCRFSDRITGNLKSYAENCKIIHIDIDPAEIGKNVSVDLPVVADAKHALQAIISEFKNAAQHENNSTTIAKSEWTRRMKEYNEMCQCICERDSHPISPIFVMKKISKILDSDDVVCTGVGQHQMYASHFLKFRNPRTFLSSGGAGTMGFGLPAAIGAKVGKPKSEVYDIDGDGSFQMTLQELGTCSTENIKINPVIMSNHYLGMVRQWLEIFFDKRYSQVNLDNNPDFVKIAEAYGLEGMHVSRADELEEALTRQKKAKDTFLLNIEIEKESNILPMLPPAGHLRDAFGGCMAGKGRFF